jgi:hypothetical protein
MRQLPLLLQLLEQHLQPAATLGGTSCVSCNAALELVPVVSAAVGVLPEKPASGACLWGLCWLRYTTTRLTDRGEFNHPGSYKH